MNPLIINLDQSSYLSYIEHTNKDFLSRLYVDNLEVGSYNLSLSKDNTAYMDTFIVHENLTGNGYGKLLALSIKKLSNQLEIDSVFFHSNPYKHKKLNESKLIAFYEKHLDAHIIDYSDLGTLLCFENILYKN